MGELYFPNSVFLKLFQAVILGSKPSQENAGLGIQHFNESIFSGSE